MAQEHLILTPTSRLARVQLLAFAEAQRDAGTTAWRAPAIMSFSAWIGHLQEETLLFGALGELPGLLPASRAQAAWLWQAEVDPDVFIGRPRVAELAQRAWQTLHDYQLPTPDHWPDLALSEDSRQFQRWAQRYQRRLHELQLMDEAQFARGLPRFIAAGLVQVPERIELCGFDLAPTPLLQRILDSCAEAGSKVHGQGGRGTPAIAAPGSMPTADVEPQAAEHSPLTLTRFTDADSELRAAARWAREHLENNAQQQLAIVVSDLAGRIDAVDRQLREVFDAPGFLLQGSGEDPWHLSLGKPLADWPLVRSALKILRLSPRRLSQPELHELAQSAFLPGAGIDAAEGALARLALDAPYFVTLDEWLYALHPADDRLHGGNQPAAASTEDPAVDQEPGRATALRSWQARCEAAPDGAWPSRWARQFQEELTAIGFARGRALSSREYQTLERWHGLLEDFARLDTVLEAPLSRGAALGELAVQAAGAVFRERNVGARLEVLGVQEALGARFDGLWITGLDATGWPGPVRREPLLPAVYQRELPGATSDGCLERARLELAALRRVAPELRLSYAAGTDDAPLAPTALLAEIARPMPLVPTAIDEAGPAADAVDPSSEVRSLNDWLLSDAPATPPLLVELDASAPPLATAAGSATVSGGTGILSSQSACPFQAFARYRLNARELRLPRPGLSPQERGQLAHGALEQLFRGTPSQAALKAQTLAQREAAISAAVTRTLDQAALRYRYRFSASSRDLEHRRLERLLTLWIDRVEIPRDAFTVEDPEQQLELEIGGLRLRGQIDRIDRLDSGERILIDYKSSAPPRSHLEPDARIREPQLPAYALSLAPPPAAVAFGNLAPAKLGYSGLGAPGTGLTGIFELDGNKVPRGSSGEPRDWATVRSVWKENLERLATNYLQGEATVDPRDASVCRHCHLSALCRIGAESGEQLEAAEGEAAGQDGVASATGGDRA